MKRNYNNKQIKYFEWPPLLLAAVNENCNIIISRKNKII